MGDFHLRRRSSRMRTEASSVQTILVVTVLFVVGATVGLVIGPRFAPGLDPKVENYVLLAYTLYTQGESPTAIRDRLTQAGIAKPGDVVSDIAVRYATSRDKKLNQQATALDTFGKILTNPESFITPTAQPTETPLPSTATPTPIGSAASPTRVLTTPSPIAPPAANPSVPPAASPAAPAPTAAASVAPQPGAPTSYPARATISVEAGATNLRREPNTTSPSVARLGGGVQVDVLEPIRGQEVEPNNSRWYRVRFGNQTGYIWGKLLQFTDR